MKALQLILFILIVTSLATCSSPAAQAVHDLQAPQSTAADTRQTRPAAQLIGTQPANGTPFPINTPGTAVPTQAGSSVPEQFTPEVRKVPTLGPDDWKNLPIVPAISTTAVQIYQRGLGLDEDPRAFSKVGDCGSTPSWFLGDFDRGPRYYDLGIYTALEAVIQQYQGSFGRTSLAARSGFNASSVFAPIWADRTQCGADETPLACEYRIHRPSISLITLGTNDVWHQDTFESQMRAIIEYSIQKGILPVLATKADNDEGDGSINATIARLAQDYDIPLWNYWRAVQPLPDHGLQPDGAHLTWGPNRFNDPKAMESAWAVRNLTALQVLNAVWEAVGSSPNTQN
jgi:hypothetical protein